MQEDALERDVGIVPLGDPLLAGALTDVAGTLSAFDPEVPDTRALAGVASMVEVVARWGRD
jgi:precorrin-2 methylase